MSDKRIRDWHEGLTYLRKASGRYLDSLAAIQELADFAAEHVLELDKKRQILGASFGAMAGTTFLRSFAETLANTASQMNPSDLIDPMEELRKYYEEYRVNLGEEDAAALDKAVTLEKSRARTDLLMGSLLVTAVSDFEVLFSSVAECFYWLRPEALRAQDAKMAWSEIEVYASLDELKSHFIDERVSQLIREGFDVQRKWLATQLKIRYEEIALDPDRTIEVFQRRHIIVHNGGLVSGQYLSKVAGAAAKVNVGSLLVADMDYLRGAIQRLSVLGISIPHLVLRQLCRAESEHVALDEDISTLTFSALREHEWEIVQAICSIVLPGIKREYDRCVIQMNMWVARKRLKGKAAIFDEVSRWDVSALQPAFKLARKVLLEDSSAVDLAGELIENGEFSQAFLGSWPVFEDIRDEVRIRLGVSGEEVIEIDENPSPASDS